MAIPPPKRFATAAAFRASLEDRLKREAADRGVPLNTLRLKLVMERLLARLFAAADPPWLLRAATPWSSATARGHGPPATWT